MILIILEFPIPLAQEKTSIKAKERMMTTVNRLVFNMSPVVNRPSMASKFRIRGKLLCFGTLRLLCVQKKAQTWLITR